MTKLSDRLPLIALAVATSISMIGTALSAVAIPWFVLQTSGSAVKTGLTAAAIFLPGLISGIFGGTLVDRTGYRLISIGGDLVSGLAIAAIPLLYQTIGLHFWQLLVLVFVASLPHVSVITARRAMLPELAEQAGFRLDRVNTVFEAIPSLSWLIGPPMAGLLIASLGAEDVLWLDAVSFLFAAILVGLFVPFVHVASQATTSFIQSLVEGWQFLRRDALLFPMAIALGLVNCFAAPLYAVVLPVYFTETTGKATDLGLAVAAAGGGSLAGALTYGVFAGKLSRRMLWIAAFAIAPLEYFVLLTEPVLAVLIVVLVITSFVVGPLNPLMVTVRHERSPAELRGRVFSAYSAIAQAAAPFGIMVTGFAIDRSGFDQTMVGLGIGLVILAIVVSVLPAFALLDERSG